MFKEHQECKDADKSTFITVVFHYGHVIPDILQEYLFQQLFYEFDELLYLRQEKS